MTGIAAVLRTDGTAADAALVQRMTAAMSFRGPDRSQTRLSGAFGAGATHSSQLGNACLAADESIIVVCYSRIDARRELIDTFRSKGRQVDADATDAELFLHAYHTWDAAFLERLIGDFALILWDEKRRTLHAAVDRFAVKPLYYAVVDGALLVTNTPTAILENGLAPDDIDEIALGDLLSLGFPSDPSATVHRAVRRIPPAHRLTACGTALAVDAYWAVPPPTQCLLYRSRGDYAEHFREIFFRAVEDRLPQSGPVHIMMSGGMDSPSVAAAARELIGPDAAAERVLAHTQIYRDLIRDEEGEYARSVAEWLGIRIRMLAVEDFKFRDMAPAAWFSPEPTYAGGMLAERDIGAHVEAAGGVLLTGLGGDPLFSSRNASLPEMVRSRPLRALPDIARYVRLFGQLPRLGLRGRLRSHLGAPPSLVPIWINRAFAQRTGLFDRVARCVRDVRSAPPQQGLTGSGWSYLLASADAGRSGMPIDFRHPFIDVRLLEWAVKVPEPVLRDKAVLRASMAGLLPPRVLARPKTLLGNAAAVAERKHPAVVRRHDELLRTVPCIAEYVDVAILKRCLDDPNTRLALGLNRFEIVALWLASRVDRGTGPRYCRGVD